jgi:hypothetical protein
MPQPTKKKVTARIVNNVSMETKEGFFDAERLERIKLCIEIFGLVGVLGAMGTGIWLGLLQKQANQINHQAVGAAQNSLEAAQQSNAIAQNNLYDSHAPWIGFQDAEVTCDSKKGEIDFAVFLENDSDYPATIITFDPSFETLDLSKAKFTIAKPVKRADARFTQITILLPHQKVRRYSWITIHPETFAPTVYNQFLSGQIDVTFTTDYLDIGARQFESINTIGHDTRTDKYICVKSAIIPPKDY